MAYIVPPHSQVKRLNNTGLLLKISIVRKLLVYYILYYNALCLDMCEILCRLFPSLHYDPEYFAGHICQCMGALFWFTVVVMHSFEYLYLVCIINTWSLGICEVVYSLGKTRWLTQTYFPRTVYWTLRMVIWTHPATNSQSILCSKRTIMQSHLDSFSHKKIMLAYPSKFYIFASTIL